MRDKRAIEKLRKVFQEYSSDPVRQIKELKKLLKEAHDSGNIHYIGCCYQLLAAAYKSVENNKNLFASALKALTFLKHTDDHKMIANAYTGLGVAYFDQENYQLALANYDKAYEIIRRHRITGVNRIIVLNDLATVYSAMGDYKTGIYYLTECLEQTKKESPDGAPELLAVTLNLSDSLIYDRRPAEAVKALEDAKNWAAKVEYKTYICAYYVKYAMAEYGLKHKKQFVKYLDKALELKGELSDAYWVYEDFGRIEHMLLECGDIQRAQTVVDMIKAYCGRNDTTMDRLLLNSTMADFYKSTGQPDKAVVYYEQLEKLYKDRTNELKQVQLNIHKSMKAADSAISRLNKMILESEERAKTDPLTGLLNRSAMIRTGGEFIEAASEMKKKVGAIFIDIDCFKECNDTYGHARGDEIIKEVADLCRKEESDTVRFARYGGDEFLGMTLGLSDTAVAAIAKRISKNLREADIPNEKSPLGGRLTVSVGIVNVPVTDRTDTMIRIANYADKAVYHSKRSGKNCIHMLDWAHMENDGKEGPFVRIE
jgi:diguanylate cyclase (GGDEF)-like protein